MKISTRILHKFFSKLLCTLTKRGDFFVNFTLNAKSAVGIALPTAPKSLILCLF